VSGIYHASQDHLHETLAAVEYAVQLAEGDSTSSVRGMILANLADALTPTDPVRAAEVADRARQQARRQGQLGTYLWATANHAVALLEAGDWPIARQVLSEDVVEDDEFLDPWRCVLAALIGDVAAARRLAELPSVRLSENLQDRAAVALCEALIAQAEERWSDALRSCREILDGADALGISSEGVRWAWPIAIRAARAVGDDQISAWLLDFLGSRPPGHLPPVLLGELKLAHALDPVGQHDALDADRCAEALAALRRANNPYNLALGLKDVADHLLGCDHPDQAGPLIAEAREIGERLGCPRILDGLPTSQELVDDRHLLDLTGPRED
jgi:hypothetical protein